MGSPAFQFSYVIGLPVDIQKNLEEYDYGYHVCLGHNLAVKRVFLIETNKTYLLSSPWSVPLVQKCSWPIPEGIQTKNLEKKDMTLSKTRNEFGFVQSDINQIEKYCNSTRYKSRYSIDEHYQ